MFTSALSPEQREEALRQLADETFDILVIGGGVTGVGAALDQISSRSSARARIISFYPCATFSKTSWISISVD